MAKLYADENFSLPVVKALRQLGHDVLTIQEDGKADQKYPDELVLARASQYQRAVLTYNRKDFIQLDKTNTDHAGIFACTNDPDVPGQAQRIHEAIKEIDSLDGQVIRINRPSS